MKDQIKARARLLRVRGTQHKIAQADAMRAQHEVDRVVHNRQRVEQLRFDLRIQPNTMTGAQLATMGEFVMRLDRASSALKASEQRNRAIADVRRDACVQAQIKEEGVRRLHRRAVHAWDCASEKRLAGITRKRRRDDFSGDDE